MSAARRLRVDSQVDRLAEVRAFVRDAVADFGGSAKVADDLVQAVDEATCDAASPEGVRFGIERFHDLAGGTHHGHAEDTCRAVIQSVLGFQGDAEPADDLALLVLRRLPEG